MGLQLFVIALSLFVVSAGARERPAVTPAEREAALVAIKKWRGFEGTWEGEVRYVAAPKDEWYKQHQPFKITIKTNEPKAFIREGIREWSELGATYKVHQPDELTLLVHAYGAGGVWTENNVIVITRRSENAADVFIQRVVNNWAGESLPGEDTVYGDTRAGKVRRQ